MSENCNIKVGDIVRVVNAGERYPTYYEWFLKNNIITELCCRYAYRDGNIDNYFYNNKFVVLYVDKEERIVLVEKFDDFDSKTSIYLFNMCGVELIAEEMTLDEVCAELGRRIVIVDSKDKKERFFPYE